MNILEIIEREQKIALSHYNFHRKYENDYGLKQYFNGQRAILRKIKRKIKLNLK